MQEGKMKLFDLFKNKAVASSSQFRYADSSTISPDEREFYQPDNYYTFYSYPGTEMARKVITFDERKKISYPTPRGLYVAEVMLLDYCNKGKYPKPKTGYPGLWWFEYGIRDVGNALKSLEQRGFLRWAPKSSYLNSLKADELKKILSANGLDSSGKKEELIERIKQQIPEERIIIDSYVPKYELTELGQDELSINSYIPYMARSPHKTTEDDTFGEQFNVWYINKLLKGDGTNWKSVVGGIEKRRFGVDSANEDKTKNLNEANNDSAEDVIDFINKKKEFIESESKKPGDAFKWASKGYDLKEQNKLKEALVYFYIAINKHADMPAVYRDACIILRKYKMYEEELRVIEKEIQNIKWNDGPSEDLIKRKQRVQELISKRK